MTERTNVWGNLLSPQEYEPTSQVIPFFQSAASDLGRATDNKVSAVFHEDEYYLEIAGISSFVTQMSKVTKVAKQESQLDQRLDANKLYQTKKYVFEIINETYRFELFRIEIGPLFPIIMNIDEGVYKDIQQLLSNFKKPAELSHSITIDSQQNLEIAFYTIQKSKKLKYIVMELENSDDD